MTALATRFDEQAFRQELSRIDGKIAVTSSASAFTIFDRHGSSGVSITAPWGNYDGESLHHEEEVRDWLYQMYFAVEGR